VNVESYKLIPFSIPFVKPFKTGKETLYYRKGIWVNIQYKNYYGWGEASPLASFSKDSIEDADNSLKRFFKKISNSNLEIEEILSLARGVTKKSPSALFAIETAFFDLFAQMKNKPLAFYLNSKAIDQIKVNGLSTIHSPDDNYKVIKLKVISSNLFVNLEKIENLSNLFGNDVCFRLDINGGFDLTQAIRFCKEMENYNIDYIEQPIEKHALEDLAELRNHTAIPIALDESLIDIIDAEKIIENQSADVFIIKPMMSGGFKQSRMIMDLAKQESIRTIITSSLETHIGLMACMHLASANELNEYCGLSAGYLLNQKKLSYKVKNSSIKIPSLPGLGLVDQK